MGAIKSSKCSKGHRFTPQNTYIRKDGTRECKKCSLARATAQRLSKAQRAA